MTMNTESLHPKSKNPSRDSVWTMFDRIAPRYDLSNRVLSMGQDIRWRKKLAGMIQNQPNLQLCDLATGTADVPLMLMAVNSNLTHSIGIDMSEKMLEIGRIKVRQSPFANRIDLQHGDAMAIPYPDHYFDVVTMAFGIRNVMDVSKTLCDIKRVLKPGGRALILECSLPKHVVMKTCYLLYFRHLLPLIGGLLSGHMSAYRYLNKTVETFPNGPAFCRLMTEAGFSHVHETSLSWGIASIYQGDATSTTM